jgi:hypothetical protein
MRSFAITPWHEAAGVSLRMRESATQFSHCRSRSCLIRIGVFWNLLKAIACGLPSLEQYQRRIGAHAAPPV